MTDDDIDPIHCADCDPKISILQASRDTQPEEWSPSDFKNENNHSLVIRVQFGASKFLFPGDMEDAAIESLIDRYEGKPTLDVDVFQVSHHGSENGTTHELTNRNQRRGTTVRSLFQNRMAASIGFNPRTG